MDEDATEYPPAGSEEITRLLLRASNQDREAEEQLIQIVYAQLRKIATRALSRERSGHSLQPTALVNETYLRLLGKGQVEWKNRAHFFRLAARSMRQILIDRARKSLSEKGGGGLRPIALHEQIQYSDEESESVLRLNDCLDALTRIDPRQGSIVEMRFFGGLTEEEIGLLLGISTRTVKRDWVAARAWLQAEMLRPPQTAG